jgi:hypothetical protein
MKCYITGSQIFLSYVFLDVHVGLILDPIININWILEANHVSPLAIVLIIMDTSALIYQLVVFMCPVM